MGRGAFLSEEELDEMFDLIPFDRYYKSSTTYNRHENNVITVFIRDKADGSIISLVEMEVDNFAYVVKMMNAEHNSYINNMYSYLKETCVECKFYI